ncbi:MAG: glycosyltransferase family 2 protein [Elusimicrobiota bacterium]
MISVCVPAFNEEKNIRGTALTVLQAARETGVDPIEVLIVNDGSSDGTAAEIAKLEREFPSIRSITHPRNMGLGRSYMDVIAAAKYGKISLFPGDNSISLYTIKNVFKNRDKADVIISYYNNTELRSLARHAISTLVNLIYGSTFGVHARYVQGASCLTTERVRRLNIFATEHTIQAEIHVKLIRSGSSYMEVDGYYDPRSYSNRSVAFRRKTIVNALSAYLNLVYEIFVRHPDLYRHKPVRVLPLP